MMEDQGSVHRHQRIRGLFLRLCTIAIAGCWISSAHAQSPPSSAQSTNAPITLAPVVVTGQLPGPALWKVSNGKHVMWILGLVSPVPKHMQWKFNDIDRRIASSQAVLKPPGLEVGTDSNGSGNAALRNLVISLRKNPHDASLSSVLSPALYRHWRMQKDRYLPDDYHVDHWRPIFAGRALYDAVLDRKGLADEVVIEKTVYDAADRHRVKVIDAAYQLALEHPADTIGTLRWQKMDDQRCLGLVLDAVEHDLAQATVRANAWATGDIDTLKTVLMQTQEDSCLAAVGSSPFAKIAGMTDMQQRIDQAWMAQADQALHENAQTVALLPMEELFKPKGYLDVLKSHGYAVTAPAE